MKYIVMTPHDKIKNQTTDAHSGKKLSKFIIGQSDLIDRSKGPTPDNFRFESCQAEHADIVIYVDEHRDSHILKGENLCEDVI